MNEQNQLLIRQIREFMILLSNTDDEDEIIPEDSLISFEYILKCLSTLQQEITKETMMKQEMYERIFFTNYNQQLLYVTTANYSPYLTNKTESDFKQILALFDV
ncbi:hypothetical protein WA158_001418 [Blastocystis sp. Blastoise]